MTLVRSWLSKRIQAICYRYAQTSPKIEMARPQCLSPRFQTVQPQLIDLLFCVQIANDSLQR